jgi:integrase
MAMKKKLTARQVETLGVGRHGDGGNLYLQVTPSGAKSWLFIYRFAGKQKEAGLGAVARVSLAEARQKAEEARRLLADGIDPLEARKAASEARKAASTTFKTFVVDYITSHRAGWSNAKHAEQWAMTLGEAYCASLQDKPIGEIGVADVLQVLSPVWQARPETARRVRMRLEKILDAARVMGLRTGENPARWRGNLDHLLPRHGRLLKQHHRALAYADVPAFMVDLATRPAMAARAMEFLIFTATRTSETLLAEWTEVDLEARTWTLPASRMKSRREHRVPLSDGAMAVLEAVKGKHERFIFPGPSGKAPLSNMALLVLLRRMGKDGSTTAHGFRSAFRDWAAETTSFPSEVAEMALAHVISNETEAAYRRGDLFEKRKALMQAWCSYLTASPDEKVVPIRRA